jgi:predicted nucleic acid-binding protein
MQDALRRALDLTLVTNNTQEFSRVPDLKIENWTKLPTGAAR